MPRSPFSTNEKIYDFVVSSLLAQGTVSHFVDKRLGRNNISLGTSYRSETGDRSAVGFIIPDSVYSKSLLEGYPIEYIYNNNINSFRDYIRIDDNTLEVLVELEEIHNGSHKDVWNKDFTSKKTDLGNRGKL